MNEPAWVREVVTQALRHGWVEVTITAEMGRELLAVAGSGVSASGTEPQ